MRWFTRRALALEEPHVLLYWKADHDMLELTARPVGDRLLHFRWPALREGGSEFLPDGTIRGRFHNYTWEPLNTAARRYYAKESR